MRLLTEPLYASWSPPRRPDGSARSFLAAADVGVFDRPEPNPLVPDVLLSLDVVVHPNVSREKKHNTYFVWVMGKPPDVVIELVSNKKGGELTKRKDGYLRMGVPYYVVWDPEHRLGGRELSPFMLSGDAYVPMTQADFPSIGLSLRPWDGVFEGIDEHWLRWHVDGAPLPTGRERADAEAARADAEAARADAEAARAASEAARAARLAALLRAQGIDPDTV
jgi:hypothetical protein